MRSDLRTMLHEACEVLALVEDEWDRRVSNNLVKTAIRCIERALDAEETIAHSIYQRLDEDVLAMNALCICGHPLSEHPTPRNCEGIHERFDAPPVSCSCEGFTLEVAK